MAKIKLTKTELKSQRDSMKQFTRFLPTLQLKKQQLQMEMRKCQARVNENEKKQEELKSSLRSWIALFGPDADVTKLKSIIIMKGIQSGKHNIAGVEVPVFEAVDFEIEPYDLFGEDPWIDNALDAIKMLIELQAEQEIIREQYRLIGKELQTTTQRVNLFEKVKIPECKENIRKIQIFLGDMDTSAVCRSKIAKNKIQESAA
jgi:V/A-type H+-transporting ATPase subunit D